jgi:hypothetical protein
VVSASEAATALGIDRFRTPDRLIRDKLARLDKIEGTEAVAAAAAAERGGLAAAGPGGKDLGYGLAKIARHVIGCHLTQA